jgi:TM2 domain-containing membrane protein YozV
MSETSSAGRGSTGNVIAAVCSFFIPGLGQLVQGRILWALAWFGMAVLMAVLTFVLTLGFAPFGWGLVSLLSCVHAALYRPRG